MEHGNGTPDTPLHTLIPLADFKAILGIDDREDALSRYCLITAAYTIEQYCKRRLVRRKNTDYLTFTGEHIFALREYPVCKVLAVHAATAGSAQQGESLFSPGNLVDPKHYYCLPDEGIREDIPFSLVLRPPYRFTREEMGIRVRYVAGYVPGKAPPDLASASLELAAWNMTRYRGRRIGMTGNVRGSGKDGEHSLKFLLAGRVNELLGETEYPIPPIEFSNYRGGSVVAPAINLSTCERSEKERIIRLNTYTLTIAFTVPEHPDGERNCYAYASSVATALGEDSTLGGIVDRAELTGKKHAPPKHPGAGGNWRWFYP